MNRTARMAIHAPITVLLLLTPILSLAQESAQSSSSTMSSAAASNQGIGTIVIEQRNATQGGPVGTWTILKPGDEQSTGDSEIASLSQTPAGSYTIIATPPKGATTTIRISANNGAQQMFPRPQGTFTLDPGDTVRVLVSYNMQFLGLVSLDSNPPGLQFSLIGPNNFHEEGATPASFAQVPRGQYSVTYQTLGGCRKIPTKSALLEADNRIHFTVELDCPEATALRAQHEESALKATSNLAITTTAGGTVTAVTDVPLESWFAKPVSTVVKYGIMSGYKDAQGQPTGQFGPGNHITLAELSTLGHRIAGISAEAFATDTSPWFAAPITSARSRGWTIFMNTDLDPVRPATRGEVMVTLMQAMDVPLQWQKGTIFQDVTTTTTFAAAIETAAKEGLVEGKKDVTGQPLHLFGPADSVTRAEMAKVISAVLKKYRGVE